MAFYNAVRAEFYSGKPYHHGPAPCRIVINFGKTEYFNAIELENYHDHGEDTQDGVNVMNIYYHDQDVDPQSEVNDNVGDYTQIFGGGVDEHGPLDQSDIKNLELT